MPSHFTTALDLYEEAASEEMRRPLRLSQTEEISWYFTQRSRVDRGVALERYNKRQMVLSCVADATRLVLPHFIPLLIEEPDRRMREPAELPLIKIVVEAITELSDKMGTRLKRRVKDGVKPGEGETPEAAVRSLLKVIRYADVRPKKVWLELRGHLPGEDYTGAERDRER